MIDMYAFRFLMQTTMFCC